MISHHGSMRWICKPKLQSTVTTRMQPISHRHVQGQKERLWWVLMMKLSDNRLSTEWSSWSSSPVHWVCGSNIFIMGRHSCSHKQKLKKGLWSPEEDEKLVRYITKHGHGCWSAVPKEAGELYPTYKLLLLLFHQSCRWLSKITLNLNIVFKV